MSSDFSDKKKTLAEDIEASATSESASIASLQKKLDDQEQFISTLIHEIRNPLNSVEAVVILLRQAETMDAVKRLAGHLSKSSQLMNETINDLLEFRRVDSGDFRRKTEDVDLPEVCEELVSAFKALAIEHEIDLRFEQIHEILPIIKSDRALIRSIIANLLSNALRYTDRGGRVVLKCSAEPELRGRYKITFELVDTGVGISEGDLPRIFEAFYKGVIQSPHHETRSGLGLSICKRMADKLGGQLTCESNEGEGSSFQLHIKCQGSYPRDSIEESQKIRQMELKRVLLIVSDEHEQELHAQFDHPQILLEYGGDIADFELGLYGYIFIDLRTKQLQEIMESIASLRDINIELIGFCSESTHYHSSEFLREGIRCVYPKSLTHENICSVMELHQNPAYKGDYYWFDPHKVSELLSWDDMSRLDHGKAIVDIFLKGVPSTLRCLQRASDLKEWNYLQKMSESMIHSFESIGASRLLACLGQMQDALLDRNQVMVRKLINQLKIKHRKATRELNEYLCEYSKLNGG